MEERLSKRVSVLHTSGRGVEGVEPAPKRPAGYLRTEMPTVASFIDELRATFGADQVDPAIRAGMAGKAGYFWAQEGGQSIGTAWEAVTRGGEQ